jgi:hypothetical protein
MGRPSSSDRQQQSQTSPAQQQLQHQHVASSVCLGVASGTSNASPSGITGSGTATFMDDDASYQMRLAYGKQATNFASRASQVEMPAPCLFLDRENKNGIVVVTERNN